MLGRKTVQNSIKEKMKVPEIRPPERVIITFLSLSFCTYPYTHTHTFTQMKLCSIYSGHHFKFKFSFCFACLALLPFCLSPGSVSTPIPTHVKNLMGIFLFPCLLPDYVCVCLSIYLSASLSLMCE